MSDPYSARPWLKSYDEHVPERLDYPEKTYPQVFREVLERVPDRVAVNYMGAELTFRELDTCANQFAHYLKKQGVLSGDVVGVNLPNLPAYFISIVGIQKAGCVLTGVSPLLQPEELEYQLNDSGAKVLVTLDLLFAGVEKVVKKTGVKAVAVAGIADFLPGLKKFLGKLLKKIPTGTINPIDGIEVVGYLDILNTMPTDMVETDIKPESPMLMQYTGGTTGLPKGAVLTHRNIVSHMLQLNTWAELKMGDEGTMLSAFPLFHQAGLFIGLDSMASGLTQIAIPNPRDLDFIIKAMKKHRPTTVVNVPTIFIELLKKPEFRALDFTALKWCASGAAPFPPEYIKEFEKVVGEGKLIEVLGMTETSPILVGLPLYGKKKAGSAGIPFPDTDIKLVDPTTGELVPIGDPGEFVARGPQVFTIGYHNKPEETAHTLRDGWIYTGDICTMDEDGYFYIVDRLKDMVNVSGFKVFTRELDDEIMEHPDVDLAATIGLPNPERPGSEIVATAIVLRPGVEKSEETQQMILDYIKQRVAPYKVPKRIDFMDELPTSAVGKVLKRELREIMK
ncbi:MAG: AMP-binding protein [Deltaproteobacteria bacterium]|nr:AMP-binding protein [Deltaproteobacteria bacterium]